MKTYFLVLIFFLSSFIPGKAMSNQYVSFDFEGRQISIEEIQALAGEIRENTIVKYFFLDLSDNQIGHEGVQYLAEAIADNTTIKVLSLDLKNNNINPTGAQALANAIRNNSTIEILELGLSNNQIEDEGVQFLAEAIRDNVAIKRLTIWLSSNGLSVNAIQFLEDAIRANTIITENLQLDLSDNQIVVKSIISLKNTRRQVIERNRQFFIRFLELFNNSEFSDAKIRGIPVHNQIIVARLGDQAYNNLETILGDSGLSDENVKAFIKWVYTGSVETDQQEIVGQICNRLGINFVAKNGEEGFRRDMQELYDSRDETGDFTIIVQGRVIKAHKAVLIARSGLFKGMFFTVAGGKDVVTDRFGATPKEFKQLLEYIYTAREPELTTQESLARWTELKEYYQVD